MTKRLEMICSLVKSSIGIADIGTDHGMIPVHYAQCGYNGYIWATDINEAPLNRALNYAAECGVQDRISFHLADGLDFCDPDKIDTVILAGMGGELVISILDRVPWIYDERYQLIFQPMTKAEVLRFWLCNNGFIIEEERLVTEGGKLFSIFSARFKNQNTPYRDAELYVGKRKQLENDPLYTHIIEKEYERLCKRMNGLEHSGEIQESDFYRSILLEFMQMRD